MKVTILGCGTSSGVPMIGNHWGECDPNEPRNRRLRASIFVEQADTALIVDTSPDMRQQLLNCNAQRLDAVLYTHAHADHCHGIDELRSVNWMMKKPIDVYASAQTLEELKTRFSYIFGGFEEVKPGHFHKPAVNAHAIKGPFKVGDINIAPFAQDHGDMETLGFRFGNIAYSTDAKSLDQEAFKALEGVRIWIVDCARETLHPTHSNLEQTLDWIARVKPEKAYLTHMNHTMDYATLCAKLPPHIRPAYDGLVIEC